MSSFENEEDALTFDSDPLYHSEEQLIQRSNKKSISAFLFHLEVTMALMSSFENEVLRIKW